MDENLGSYSYLKELVSKGVIKETKKLKEIVIDSLSSNNSKKMSENKEGFVETVDLNGKEEGFVDTVDLEGNKLLGKRISRRSSRASSNRGSEVIDIASSSGGGSRQLSQEQGVDKKLKIGNRDARNSAQK